MTKPTMQKLHGTMIRASQGRWRLLFALIIALQIAGTTHLIGHSAAGDNAGCAVCLAASEAGGALPAAATAAAAFHPVTSAVPEDDTQPFAVANLAGYRARAPPVS